jgi:hypothetical protein
VTLPLCYPDTWQHFHFPQFIGGFGRMSQHHGHSHDKEHGLHHSKSGKKIHHDWRFWAVIAMLVAMGIYVMTMDEAIEPGGGVQQEVPADAE